MPCDMTVWLCFGVGSRIGLAVMRKGGVGEMLLEGRGLFRVKSMSAHWTGGGHYFHDSARDRRKISFGS